MSNGSNRSRGDQVAKITKASAGVIKGPQDGLCESETAIRFNYSVDGNVVSVPRSRNSCTKVEIADQIGLGLRSVYNDILSQPVPDRFFDLLKQLERAQGALAKKDAP